MSSISMIVCSVRDGLDQCPYAHDMRVIVPSHQRWADRYFGPLVRCQRTCKNSRPALADYQNWASAIPLFWIFGPISKSISKRRNYQMRGGRYWYCEIANRGIAKCGIENCGIGNCGIGNCGIGNCRIANCGIANFRIANCGIANCRMQWNSVKIVVAELRISGSGV